MIKVIERRIRGKMMCIKNGTLTPEKSNIAVLFNKLRNLDMALYENLIEEYKEVIYKFNK